MSLPVTVARWAPPGARLPLSEAKFSFLISETTSLTNWVKSDQVALDFVSPLYQQFRNPAHLAKMGNAREFPSPPFLRSLFCLELRWAPAPFLIPSSNSLNPAGPSVHLRLALLPQKTPTVVRVFSQLQQLEPPGQLPAHLLICLLPDAATTTSIPDP